MEYKQRHAIECRIAKAAADALIASGFTISVNDGGETVLKDSTSWAAIKAAMFSTDEDYFYVTRKVGEQTVKGWIHFVYGNDGWDVLADHTTNLEETLTPATELAEKIAEGK